MPNIPSVIHSEIGLSRQPLRHHVLAEQLSCTIIMYSLMHVHQLDLFAVHDLHTRFDLYASGERHEERLQVDNHEITYVCIRATPLNEFHTRRLHLFRRRFVRAEWKGKKKLSSKWNHACFRGSTINYDAKPEYLLDFIVTLKSEERSRMNEIL